MIRLAIRSLRHRAAGFVAAFLAIFLGAAIVMACGGLMETGIRTAVPPQQLAGADVVVAGEQQYEVPGLSYTVVLPERVRIEADLVATITDLPGVQDVTAHVFDDPAPEGSVDVIAVSAEAGTGADEIAERIDAELSTGAPGTAVTLTGDERGLAELPQAGLCRASPRTPSGPLCLRLSPMVRSMTCGARPWQWA